MEKEKFYYKPDTEAESEHMVAKYTGLNLMEIQDLDLDVYLYYLRQAYIHYLNQSEEGREYLEKCFIFVQTKPDRAALRRNFGAGRGR